MANPTAEHDDIDDLPLDEIDETAAEDLDDVLEAYPAAAPASLEKLAVMQILPADFELPALIRFVPNQAWLTEATAAAEAALAIDVKGEIGLQRADEALSRCRAAQSVIVEGFKEPCQIADRLHKTMTGKRADWLVTSVAAIDTVGRRVYAERQRLAAIEAEKRRAEQAEADKRERERLAREAEAAAEADAPEEIVEELKQQAQTATAAPVASAPSSVPALRGSTSVTTYKARIAGTPGDTKQQPETSELTMAQLEQVYTAMRAILEKRAPVTIFNINWSVLNGRAKADKETFNIPGFEVYKDGNTRAKGGRR